jgi:uncharacterized protein (DUF2252 family)
VDGKRSESIDPGSSAENERRGRAARRQVPRAAHGFYEAHAGRPDPVAVLQAEGRCRVPELVPLRYERMAVSPFSFYRGSAGIMAWDLAQMPASGLVTQLCGDAHAANFGVFASPERTLLFDVNDFDECHIGPFEWDVKRLGASLVLAGAESGLRPKACWQLVRSSTAAYRRSIRQHARMGELDVWYARIPAGEVDALLKGQASRRVARRLVAKARRRTHLRAFSKLTTVVDGERRFVEDPPLLEHAGELSWEQLRCSFGDYRRSLDDDRRLLLERYRIVDSARKVVGVGSVGTRCYIALLQGRDDGDPLILQAKEAGTSVLEPYTGPPRYRHGGRRVAAGQRLMQAASDIFLGWGHGPGDRHYYWRQLYDMKSKADPSRLGGAELTSYGRLCGAALARAHARSGHRIAIAAYLGGGDRFDRAIADFARAYAEQAEADHVALLRALASGQLGATGSVAQAAFPTGRYASR